MGGGKKIKSWRWHVGRIIEYGVMKKNCGNRAVVTGGASGIGLAIGEAMYRAGMDVHLIDCQGEALAEAIRAMEAQPGGGRVRGERLDVREMGLMDEMVERIERTDGPIDVWVNNAGLARHQPIESICQEDVDRVIDVNLKGTIYGSCAAFRVMKQRGNGHIINIISTASLRGIPTESVYCAAKWGVRGFTSALQEEAAPHGIRVTAILPGGVDTSFWKEARKKATPTDSFLQGTHIAGVVMQCLEQDPKCVVREIVIRSIQDTDFGYGGGE